MSTSEQFRFYVNCPAGFESVLAMEYHQNNLVRVKVKKSEDVHDKQSTGEDPGGMEFEGPLEHIFSANLNLRSASRVSVRIGEFIAITFAELRKKPPNWTGISFCVPDRPSISKPCVTSPGFTIQTLYQRGCWERSTIIFPPRPNLACHPTKASSSWCGW